MGTEGTVSVPDVSDMSQENAEAAIIAAGLAVGTVSEAFSETVAMGYVISQFPSAGQFVLLDSSVDIVVSKGPAPISPDVVLIPGGTFSMGDNFNEGNVNERPVHTVTLDSFYMGKYEITNQQYCDFLNWADDNGWITVTSNIVYKADTSYPYCDTHASSTYSQIAYSGGVFSVLAKAGRSMANDPMVRISWYGAVAYCNWRSQQEGKESCYNLSTWEYDFSKKGYHLPTEAEWEYAARGGLGSKRFPWGDTITQTQANFKSSSAYPYDISIVKNIFHPLWNDGTNSYTAPVGFFDGTVKYKIDYNWPSSDTSYQTTSGANGYGLYDMAGNVYEWCNDWYSDTYYESSPELNPLGPTTGTYRTIRSSSWIHNAFYCRVAQRQPTHPEGRNDTGGFRIALGY
jgi:formylglycine-generating enzyme required for sulfatase activity